MSSAEKDKETNLKEQTTTTQGSVSEVASSEYPDLNSPDSVAEATTAPLKEDQLGGHATQDDVKK